LIDFPEPSGASAKPRALLKRARGPFTARLHVSKATAGTLLLGIIVGLSLGAPYITPLDPLHAPTGAELLPPSWAHPLGTDLLGRDVWSRVLYGGRQTLLIALLAVGIAVLPGAAIGVLAGVTTRQFDAVIGIFLNAVLAFPPLLLALMIRVIIGTGPLPIAVAVGGAGIAPVAQVMRRAARSVLVQPYIDAARSIGASPARIVRRHVLPNVLLPLLGFTTVTLSWTILNAATLYFLGLGGEGATPEWGSMLAQGRIAFAVAPWAALAPGTAIMITLLAVNLLA